MTTISKALGPFPARFWHRLRFFDDLKACWPPPRPSFAPARRFSARFGHLRWCPKLQQNRWHDATHLSGCDEGATPFPRMIAGLPTGAGQHQVIHGRGHDHAPALELLGRAHMYLRPEQILLEEAIGVLMRKSPLITGHHFIQRQRFCPQPEEPTLTRITLRPFRAFTQHPVDPEIHLPRLPEVQLLPGLHLNGLAPMIGAMPGGIGLSPCLGLASLKQVAILAGRSSLPRNTR